MTSTRSHLYPYLVAISFPLGLALSNAGELPGLAAAATVFGFVLLLIQFPLYVTIVTMIKDVRWKIASLVFDYCVTCPGFVVWLARLLPFASHVCYFNAS